MIQQSERICRTCSKPESAHGAFKHAFVGDNDSPSLQEKRIEQAPPPSGDPSTQESIRLPSQSDPVLRMALIRAGVITVADLDAVESELRATGVSGYEPPKSLG